jgi:hypothetical protein
MPPNGETLPVFALDASGGWNDLRDAISGNANYQVTVRGAIIPLLLFAPLTTPDNLDAWAPMRATPENLLVVSIARKVDAMVLRALAQTEAELGPVRHAATCPAVRLNLALPLADVYTQMTAAGILVFTNTQTNPDAPSFFFLRGPAAVLAFDRELRHVTS